MRQSLVAIYLHLIWATWDRLPLLDEAIERPVHRSIQAKAESLGVPLLKIGGVEDHVHLLVELPATLAVADLVKGLKGASTHLVNSELAPGGSFKWQGAYAAFSVGHRQLDQVRDYIARQREHHASDAPAIHWERKVFASLYSSPEALPAN
jgi:putative transposase